MRFSTALECMRHGVKVTRWGKGAYLHIRKEFGQYIEQVILPAEGSCGPTEITHHPYNPTHADMLLFSEWTFFEDHSNSLLALPEALAALACMTQYRHDLIIDTLVSAHGELSNGPSHLQPLSDWCDEFEILTATLCTPK